MFDPDAPSSKAVFAELQSDKLRRDILRYALWRTGSEADANDLVADAIEWACDPERKPWDARKISFFAHIRRVSIRSWTNTSSSRFFVVQLLGRRSDRSTTPSGSWSPVCRRVGAPSACPRG